MAAITKSNNIIIPDGHWGSRHIIEIKDDTYAAYVDNNENYYMDCSKKKIWTKLAVHTIIRPIHGAVKTVAIPISIALEIIYCISRQARLQTMH
jgi:hypothetical protein